MDDRKIDEYHSVVCLVHKHIYTVIGLSNAFWEFKTCLLGLLVEFSSLGSSSASLLHQDYTDGVSFD